MIPQQLRMIMQGRFVRNVSILVGGTAFSQLIALLALPFVTRLYTPEDFTILATYASILGIITSIACLRFEIAIPIPKEQEDAIHLFVLSLVSVVFITLLTWLTISIGKDWINELTNQRLVGYLWLLPIGIFFIGLYNALQYWMTREKAFPIVAKTRMTQSISGATTQLGLGYAGISPLGLLLGQLVSSGAGIFGLLRYFLKEYKELLCNINVKDIKRTFKRYDRFPKYSTWEALTNSAGIQLPILIIATLAVGAEAGFLMLAMRLLSAPMGLIGGSVAQVYLAEAPEKHHKNELKEFTSKTTITLAKLGIIPLLLVGIISPFIIPFIFGEEWGRTGILISWMTPWFFMQFITSPISMSLHITNNQRIAMFLQILGLFLRGGTVWVTAHYFNKWIGEIYAISGFIFYSIYLSVVYKIISKNK